MQMETSLKKKVDLHEEDIEQAKDMTGEKKGYISKVKTFHFFENLNYDDFSFFSTHPNSS